MDERKNIPGKLSSDAQVARNPGLGAILRDVFRWLWW